MMCPQVLGLVRPLDARRRNVKATVGNRLLIAKRPFFAHAQQGHIHCPGGSAARNCVCGAVPDPTGPKPRE